VAEIFNDAEDFGGTIAGCDQREGIALLRQIAAALGGVHASDPATHRKTDDHECGPSVRAEAAREHLLEACSHFQLVLEGARPRERLAGGTGGHRDHFAAQHRAASAARRQRIGIDVVLFGEQWQPREILVGPYRGRVKLLCRQKLSVGGHLPHRAPEQVQKPFPCVEQMIAR